MKILKKIMKSMKSMRMSGIYLLWKKHLGYLLYSKKMNASHICPLKKDVWFEQTKSKSGYSGKH
jgi:hypothetical protein